MGEKGAFLACHASTFSTQCIDLMLFLKTGLLVLSATLGLTAAQNTPPPSSITLQTHSLYPPYIDDDLQNRWFDFGGDAVSDEQNNKKFSQLQIATHILRIPCL
jgi:hypothetical protein